MALSAHHQELKDYFAKFSDKEIAPIAAEIDKKGEIPQSIIDQLGANGFLGSYVPTEYGGAGMDYLSYALLVEEISRNCASTGVLISAHTSLCVWPILNYGNENQKKKYLPKLATGEHIGCFCLSEPNAGSDAGSLTTFATKTEGGYLINGVKNYITNGKEASIAVVLAKTTKTPNHKGISAFIVETKNKGFSIIKLEDKLGIKGSSTAQIAFDNYFVPDENLLGEYEKGFRIALSTLDGGRIGIAAQALGIARGAFEYALKYSKIRNQFGAPISQLQGVQFMLADMSTNIQASSLLIEHASHLKDQKKEYSKESATCKLFASETAMMVTTKAIQVLGGNGYTKEYPVERFFRDAKITEIYEGTSEVQRLVIASIELSKV